MTLQAFLTLIVLGALLGGLAALTGKAGKRALPLHLIAAIAGVFAGWLLYDQISRSALQIAFSLGGGLLALWIVKALKR